MALATFQRVNIINLLKSPIKCSNTPKLFKLFQRMQTSKATSTTKERAPSCFQPSGRKCGDHFRNQPCEHDKNGKKAKQPQPAPPALPKDKSEIKIKRNIYCCGDPCPDALPRFDMLYYRRSDKAQRSYQQTWDECPEQFIRPKVICCHEPIKAKFNKRPPKERPQTACKQEVCLQSKSKCPYIKMPRCRGGRKPPTCLPQRKPAKCLKRKSPYPAFSECKRKPPQRRHPIECKCLLIPSSCEVWAYHHRQQAIKKPSQC